MNKTSRTDEPYVGDGYNQSPNAMSNDLVTNQDLNGIANDREQRGRGGRNLRDTGQIEIEENTTTRDVDPLGDDDDDGKTPELSRRDIGQPPPPPPPPANPLVSERRSLDHPRESLLEKLRYIVVTFGKFVGPGFLVSVAYIDPGNYSTDIVAGASYRFRLLFVVLMSNLIAIFLQSLSIKLGTVTGLNLAEACRAFLPRWLNYFLYFMAEAAIIATDIAEVIGTAIALNLLIPQLPLVAGCALSILDVMVILIFYKPQGSMKGLRLFEFFVMLLVLAVVICFCLQLSLIENTTPGEVFQGYLPSSAVAESQGLLQSCGILGATVMPHSLYLGSGIVQSRLRNYDETHDLLPPSNEGREGVRPGSVSHSILQDGKHKSGEDTIKTRYVPSLAAIQHSLKYSYAETALSLFTFALFVNSAILIVAGASLYGNPDALEADIFGIHALLSSSISPAAGTIFALALLFSGVSAGVVCTISGQMVCEGALRWRVRPWLRRLVTRSVSITPSIIIAGAAGRVKLNAALNGSQVALSVALPFVSAPLIYFTCCKRHMRVLPGAARYVVETGSMGMRLAQSPRIAVDGDAGDDGNNDRDNADAEEGEGGVQLGAGGANADTAGTPAAVCMANNWFTTALGIAIWLLIVVMNVANLVLLGVEG
ncbi:NRAMP-like transporter smf-3 [Diatrype stigma]|uniref:NRAMP-like transporter smf-3 n=1 Tax=Diatrype stigma TaxID=117547 RepID=A0AAN9UZK9_9PEZI